MLLANIHALSDTLSQCAVLDGKLQDAAARVAGALRSGNKLLVCGNGGSAADAMHFSTEFVSKFDLDRQPLPAICLNTNGGDLSAIGNDYSYEEVFARQVRAFGRRGDVLVAFTSSGNSRNILRAIEAAEMLGVTSIAFLGKTGGFTTGKASVELLVPGAVTARIQEAQKLLLHTLCELVEAELFHR